MGADALLSVGLTAAFKVPVTTHVFKAEESSFAGSLSGRPIDATRSRYDVSVGHGIFVKAGPHLQHSDIQLHTPNGKELSSVSDSVGVHVSFGSTFDLSVGVGHIQDSSTSALIDQSGNRLTKQQTDNGVGFCGQFSASDKLLDLSEPGMWLSGSSSVTVDRTDGQPVHSQTTRSSSPDVDISLTENIAHIAVSQKQNWLGQEFTAVKQSDTTFTQNEHSISTNNGLVHDHFKTSQWSSQTTQVDRSSQLLFAAETKSADIVVKPVGYEAQSRDIFYNENHGPLDVHFQQRSDGTTSSTSQQQDIVAEVLGQETVDPRTGDRTASSLTVVHGLFCDQSEACSFSVNGNVATSQRHTSTKEGVFVDLRASSMEPADGPAVKKSYNPGEISLKTVLKESDQLETSMSSTTEDPLETIHHQRPVKDSSLGVSGIESSTEHVNNIKHQLSRVSDHSGTIQTDTTTTAGKYSSQVTMDGNGASVTRTEKGDFVRLSGSPPGSAAGSSAVALGAPSSASIHAGDFTQHTEQQLSGGSRVEDASGKIIRTNLGNTQQLLEISHYDHHSSQHASGEFSAQGQRFSWDRLHQSVGEGDRQRMQVLCRCRVSSHQFVGLC